LVKEKPCGNRAIPRNKTQGVNLTARFYLLRIQKSNGKGVKYMHDFINLMGGLMAYGLAAFGMLFIAAKMEAAEAAYMERRRRERA
jgi:hypothetical protein